MTASEKEEIRNRIDELHNKRKEIQNVLRVYEGMLNRGKLPQELVLPVTSDIEKWNPNLTDRYQKVISENLDTRFKNIMSGLTPKSKRKKKPTKKRKPQKRGITKADINKFLSELPFDEEIKFTKYRDIIKRNDDLYQIIDKKDDSAVELNKKKLIDSMLQYIEIFGTDAYKFEL